MGLDAVMERLPGFGWFHGPGGTCRECGYRIPEDKEWATEIHASGLGIIVLDVCPECDTSLKTRWSPAQ